MGVIDKYMKEGIIIQIPKKLDDKRELFKFVSGLFEDDRDYTEKEINELLSKIYPDYVLLRRYLVDFKFLQRNDYGTSYIKNNIKD